MGAVRISNVLNNSFPFISSSASGVMPLHHANGSHKTVYGAKRVIDHSTIRIEVDQLRRRPIRRGVKVGSCVVNIFISSTGGDISFKMSSKQVLKEAKVWPHQFRLELTQDISKEDHGEYFDPNRGYNFILTKEEIGDIQGPLHFTLLGNFGPIN